jgi:hypothetical protein
VRHEAKRVKNVGVAAFVYIIYMRLGRNCNGLGEWVHISLIDLKRFSMSKAYPKVAKDHTMSLELASGVYLPSINLHQWHSHNFVGA